MTKLRDLLGLRFGRLLVTGYIGGSSSKKGKWICKCDCGNTHDVSGGVLTTGRSESCGCLASELAEKRGRIAMTGKTKENAAKRHPLYTTWCGMIARCHQKTSSGYKKYGAKDIHVCEKWRGDFFSFVEDMGDKPSSKHTIDRIDPTGNYNASNCRWATSTEQARNKVKTVITIKIANEIREKRLQGRLLKDLAAEYGVHISTISLIAKSKIWKDAT